MKRIEIVLNHVTPAHVRHVLPAADFEAMSDYIKSKNFTTTESNADNVINVHVEGRAIKIGGY